jgi:hypothetical protein
VRRRLAEAVVYLLGLALGAALAWAALGPVTVAVTP